MKRLNKPTKYRRDNLLNFQKISIISLKHIWASNLSEYLKSKTMFSWLHVFTNKTTCFWENQISHTHLKPKEMKRAVEGEV
jgi:hypothetical protein